MDTFDNIVVYVTYMFLIIGMLGLAAGFASFVDSNRHKYKWCHRIANWLDSL